MSRRALPLIAIASAILFLAAAFGVARFLWLDLRATQAELTSVERAEVVESERHR